MKEPSNDLGQRLRQFRKLAGLSLKELSAKVGSSESHLGAIERGRVDNPRLQLVISLSECFGMTLSDFLGQVSVTDLSAEAQAIARCYDMDLSESEQKTLLLAVGSLAPNLDIRFRRKPWIE